MVSWISTYVGCVQRNHPLIVLVVRLLLALAETESTISAAKSNHVRVAVVDVDTPEPQDDKSTDVELFEVCQRMLLRRVPEDRFHQVTHDARRLWPVPHEFGRRRALRTSQNHFPGEMKCEHVTAEGDRAVLLAEPLSPQVMSLPRMSFHVVRHKRRQERTGYDRLDPSHPVLHDK